MSTAPNAAPLPGVTPPPTQPPWLVRNAAILWLALVVAVSAVIARGLMLAGKFGNSSLTNLTQSLQRTTRGTSTFSSSLQSQAEQDLADVAAGNAAAADKVLAESPTWTGKTNRSKKAEQFLNVALESHDLHIRQAAVQAYLALDDIPQNTSGLDTLERWARNPQQRTWALWMIGAIGNRGVDPQRSAKILDVYLSDRDANIRGAAANALGILATDETVPTLLDRFRNDSSAFVQERAACSLAEAGLYSHEQRMVAAASLVNFLDDPGLTAPQREWTLHALRDISGQNAGNDSAAWRQWYEASH